MKANRDNTASAKIIPFPETARAPTMGREFMERAAKIGQARASGKTADVIPSPWEPIASARAKEIRAQARRLARLALKARAAAFQGGVEARERADMPDATPATIILTAFLMHMDRHQRRLGDGAPRNLLALFETVSGTHEALLNDPAEQEDPRFRQTQKAVWGAYSILSRVRRASDQEWEARKPKPDKE